MYLTREQAAEKLAGYGVGAVSAVLDAALANGHVITAGRVISGFAPGWSLSGTPEWDEHGKPTEADYFTVSLKPQPVRDGSSEEGEAAEAVARAWNFGE